MSMYTEIDGEKLIDQIHLILRGEEDAVAIYREGKNWTYRDALTEVERLINSMLHERQTEIDKWTTEQEEAANGSRD